MTKLAFKLGLMLISLTTGIVQSANGLELKQNTSQVWQQYLSDPNQSELIDFSEVGVNYGHSAIELKPLPVFKVTDFGAIANDGIEDKQAIQEAILAAETAGGGIVLFPAGRLNVNEMPNQRSGIQINRSNVVLQGTGEGKHKTELFMKFPLAPVDPKKMWTVPPMVHFIPKHTPPPSSEKELPLPKSTVVKNSKVGDTVLVIADAKAFKAGDLINIHMQNLAANDEFLQGKTPRFNWQLINTKGVRVSESVEIKRVEGSKLTLVKPLLTNIDAKYGWTVRVMPHISHVGIENMTFTGNFKDEFVHHKNATHDSGFSAVQLSRTTHSWARNLVFNNVSGAVTVTGGVANSVLLNVIQGNRGHFSFNINFGTRNIIGLNIDNTNHGQWHGPGASHLSVGNVVWKFISPKSRGIDSHGLFPRHTLFDDITSFGFGGWGGNYKNLPNHLGGLVFWNFKQTGEKVGEWHQGAINFWQTQAPKSQPYTFYSAVNPMVVGYQGSAEGILEKHVGKVESFGKPVEPQSLYEAQLLQRGKTGTSWLTEALIKWDDLKKRYLH